MTCHIPLTDRFCGEDLGGMDVFSTFIENDGTPCQSRFVNETVDTAAASNE